MESVHTYIVIEKKDPKDPRIVTDDEGKPLVFKDYTDAFRKSKECKDGQVITLI